MNFLKKRMEFWRLNISEGNNSPFLESERNSLKESRLM